VREKAIEHIDRGTHEGHFAPAPPLVLSLHTQCTRILPLSAGIE
jgi:hypothetical protein